MYSGLIAIQWISNVNYFPLFIIIMLSSHTLTHIINIYYIWIIHTGIGHCRSAFTTNNKIISFGYLYALCGGGAPALVGLLYLLVTIFVLPSFKLRVVNCDLFVVHQIY